MLKQLLLAGLGGGIGSMLRLLITYLFPNQNFPYSTLVINIAGSFAIGILAAFFLKNGHNAGWAKIFLITGVCGGFTTFSAFSLENVELLSNGRYMAASLYICGSILLCIIAAFFGFKLIQ